MAVLVDIVNAVNAFGQQFSDFQTSGIYIILTKFCAWFIKWYMVAWWQGKLVALEFSYSVAIELISSLQISTFIQNAWWSLDSRTLSMLIFFRVPEALNIILSAVVTKFVFRFLGF